MTARLLACPSCARHIRASERECPFCGVSCPDSFASAPGPVRPPRGLSRAEAFRFNALVAAGVAGGGLALASAPSCGRTDNVGGLDAGRLDADAEASADSRVAFDAGFGPLYGGPAPYDAGSDEGCMGGCTDFPSSPLNDPTAPVSGDPAMLFPGDGGTGTTKDGPCLSEPANGALYPYNWLRPRVLWTAPANQTAFEVRISAAGEKNDYVVYTTNHYWALDKTTGCSSHRDEG
jgi:hypothetical protein